MSSKRIAESENPYKPPPAVPHGLGVLCSFQVGVDEIHTVTVEASIWTGLRTYAVDEAGNPGPVHRGPCDFEVGKRERHRVTIDVEGFAVVNAYVDGELIQGDLNARARTIAIIIALICALVAIILVLFGYLGIEKLVDQWNASRS